MAKVRLIEAIQAILCASSIDEWTAEGVEAIWTKARQTNRGSKSQYHTPQKKSENKDQLGCGNTNKHKWKDCWSAGVVNYIAEEEVDQENEEFAFLAELSAGAKMNGVNCSTQFEGEEHRV